MDLTMDQDSALTDQEVEEKMAAFEKKKKENQDKWMESMEKHPRCAILLSPEKLDESIGSRGSDRTDTLRDFRLMMGWVKQSKLLNTALYELGALEDAEEENVEDGVYYSFIQLAFSTAFDALRNTANPELEELVFWYYAGHGLDKEKAKKLPYLSTPCLTEATSNGCVRLDPEYHAAAEEFVTEGRKVKGGELCLHEVGFCDLYGLLKPWIAAVKAQSINAGGSKKNKHLVIILDSCYSGTIAEELKDFEKEINEQDATFLQENSVTIQAACGPNEGTIGGYFTPCFVYLNDSENGKLLSELKADWMGMTDEERDGFISIGLPSPMVVTTRPRSQQLSQDVTMELTVQNFTLTLFQDPGFFKFCAIKVYQHQDKSLFDGKERVLIPTSANAFMKSPDFTVLDYKLKTYKGHAPTDPHAGSPMGLFLLEDPKNVKYAVCAHIHFQTGNSKKHQRINLVHHKKPPFGSVRYLEDHYGLSDYQISLNLHKVPVPLDEKAENLVQACRAYVESKEPGRWNDVAQWNMTGNQRGVNELFRVQERLKERSAWEESYLEHIKKFKLPVVANN